MMALQKNMAFCAIEKMEKIYGSLRIKKRAVSQGNGDEEDSIIGR